MIKAFYLTLVVLLAATACHPPGPSDSVDDAAGSSASKVLATFDGGTVTQADFDAYLDYRTTFNAGGECNDPRPALRAHPKMLDAFVKRVAVNKLAKRLIDRCNLDPKGFLEQRLDHEAYYTAWNYVMMTVMYPDKVKAARAEFDRKMHQYYKEHADEFRETSNRVWFRMIFFDTHQADEATREQKEKQARTVRERLDRDPSKFVELAKENSDADPSVRGSVLGPYDVTAINKALGAALQKMKPGEISPVISNEKGYYILRLEKVEKGNLKPFDKVKRYIFAKLGGFYTYDIVNGYKKELLGNAKPELFFDKVSSDTTKLDDVVARCGDVTLTNRNLLYTLPYLIDTVHNNKEEATMFLRGLVEKKALYEAARARGWLDSARFDRYLEAYKDSARAHYFLKDAELYGLPAPLKDWGKQQTLINHILDAYHVKTVAEPDLD